MGRFRKSELPAQAAARWHLPISLQAGWCSCNTAVSVTGSVRLAAPPAAPGLPVLQLELEVAAEMSPWYENCTRTRPGAKPGVLNGECWLGGPGLPVVGAARRPGRRPAVPSGCCIMMPPLHTPRRM